MLIMEQTFFTSCYLYALPCDFQLSSTDSPSEASRFRIQILTRCLLVSSAHILCKQIGRRSGPTKCRAWSGSNLFDTQMVFMKEFFEKVDFEKNQQTTKKHEKLITFTNVWTEIRPNEMSGLIWIQTVWHPDGIPERIFFKKVIL